MQTNTLTEKQEELCFDLGYYYMKKLDLDHQPVENNYPEGTMEWEGADKYIREVKGNDK